MKEFLRNSSLFLVLAAGIYSCYLVSAIYHEKLLKNPYKNSNTGLTAICSEALIFTFFPPLIASIIGHSILFVQKGKHVLPWKPSLTIAGIINFNMWTYNQAVVYASFPAVVMAKSCSLLSVIIVGVFFSRVKDSKLKLTHSKILIGLVATCGIILFNFFKRQEAGSSDQPLSLFSMGNIFLVSSLIGDGFLPDFQAQLKSEHKPSTFTMYAVINRDTCTIALMLIFLTNRAHVILNFIVNYEDFGTDLLKFSILNAVGQLFIYRMIKEFRQHIPAFVIAFRKCLTVIINILWFHHQINMEQIIAIGLVFGAVFWEVYSNYKEKEKTSKAKYCLVEEDENKVKLKQKESHVGLDTNSVLRSIDGQLKEQK